MLNFLFGLKCRWMPMLRMCYNGSDSFSYQLLSDDGWLNLSQDDVPDMTLFSQYCLLINDLDCIFRFREYPLDMIALGDLDEAIVLDLDQWVPFEEGYHRLSFVERGRDSWQVAIWCWPKHLEKSLLEKLPQHVGCTHVLPEMAWNAACVRDLEPTVLVTSLHGCDGYAFLSAKGVPQDIAYCRDNLEVKRFLRGLGSRYEGVKKIFLAPQDETNLLSEVECQRPLPFLMPRLPMLSRARRKGIKDWTDPMSWKKVMVALVSLVLLWIFADVAELTHQSSMLAGELKRAKVASQQVLDQRNQVRNLHDKLSSFVALKKAQYAPEYLLDQLTLKIPDDIWLNSIRMKDGQVDLSGQGKDVARLIVLMEAIDVVEHASFLSELRPYASSEEGLEAFQLRLELKL